MKTAQVKNAVFKGNSAKYNAGGISSSALTSDMVINVTNCLFESNTGSSDGRAPLFL